jgi:hypothetical protein
MYDALLIYYLLPTYLPTYLRGYDTGTSLYPGTYEKVNFMHTRLVSSSHVFNGSTARTVFYTLDFGL